MPAVHIRVPESLTLFTIYPFCKAIQKQRPAEEIVFDFSKTRTVEPFGMLVVASEIERCVAAHPEARLTCRNFEHMTYAGHMGFFKSFGMDFDRHPGEVYGSKNYIPLTYFDTASLHYDAEKTGRQAGPTLSALKKNLDKRNGHRG